MEDCMVCLFLGFFQGMLLSEVWRLWFVPGPDGLLIEVS